MINERYKQTIFILVPFLIVFFVGFNFGQNKAKQEKPPLHIFNATSTKSVDFAAFWKAWNILDQNFVKKSSTTPDISDQDKIWGAIQGLASSYGDPYTVFFPPVESKAFGEEISGSFGGVGMEIVLRDGLLTVVAPLKDTPAYRAGIKPGDKIISIDDRPAIGMSVDEAIGLIRGKSGTSVSITFARDNVKEPLVKNIVRENINIPTVDTKLTKEGVFVISLYNFSATSPNYFRNALREFIQSGSDKLVLDLRGNPGGYLEAAIDMASWFLPSGKILVTEDFGGKRENKVYKSKGYDIFNSNLKMAILIDKGSASASEILAGALREYDKAVLVGTNTFGKGSVQELINLTEETSIKITVAHWLTPKGNSISDGGLKPDIEVISTPENAKNGNDIQLNEAIKYLLSK